LYLTRRGVKRNNCYYGLLICSNKFLVQNCRCVVNCLSSTQRVSHHFLSMFWIACSFGTGEFTYFSANTASVSMNNLVSTGSSAVATRSVVERTIVIRTASLVGVAQILAATYPLAPALKVRRNDRLRRLGAILTVTWCFINLSTCFSLLLICDNSVIPVPFILRRNSKKWKW